MARRRGWDSAESRRIADSLMPIPDDYKTVAERIEDFKTKHPEGCLRPADLAVPYRLEQVDGKSYVVYIAAAYRTPDDPTPGIGAAWELVPGPTNFTRESELQNAETSAWGRAIVAVLASESKNIASADEVQNRNGERTPTRSGSKTRQGPPVCPLCNEQVLDDVKSYQGGYAHGACIAAEAKAVEDHISTDRGDGPASRESADGSGKDAPASTPVSAQPSQEQLVP